MNFKYLPKIELHCHLDGSVRPSTVIELAKKKNIELPSLNEIEIQKLMVAPKNCSSLDEYLKRFDLPGLVMQDEEGLERIAFELMEDAFSENIVYIEIRFAPLLHVSKGLTVKQVISSVLKGIKRAENQFDIKGNLILSCMRTMSVESSYEVIESGKEFLGNGVVAVDLCSSEYDDFCFKFEKPIALARSYGYRVTIHAGETGIGKNVLDAINILKAERIGHGIFIKDHEEAYNLVKEKNITLEMCPTSNLQTKAIDHLFNYPLEKFYKDGIKVTLNTDNRTVSNVDLTNEYSVIINEFNMDEEDYKNIYLNSVKACFANDEIKNKLKRYI
ncbi:adenosine deaminase [Paraclostridium sordellii]|uniref:adenosine deaminase n=1 Tax=Paraclostridium sordellii TaxID=1505 RepID=UPI0005DF0FE9|nr:adenosine deaminase [Paeniclostridium sordellii]MBX9179447.1 adenosine deaminase [Paeniclostridium sordellii]MDU2687294.1 adenosine deaminase [Paeniclostridium sordellii]CEN86805.1 adenosine deaminase Add [[Clostridium] sordellii] [Paeniclostridium sordellii]CEP50698.1 adenosine deaminase Add [[Clostridium] sordellii] [Paeniclostridium sordellii]CEP83488.1 adenosine deaminase Add [[Clostridium] sordellii] [Paeniclostridium sordellii]